MTHAHNRDVARDKWRMRRRHQELLQAQSKLPSGPLRWLYQAVASAFVRPLVIFPDIDEYIPRREMVRRREDLVDLLWEWQGSLDVDLCDAYGCENFTDLPDCKCEQEE